MYKAHHLFQSLNITSSPEALFQHCDVKALLFAVWVKYMLFLYRTLSKLLFFLFQRLKT